MDKSQDLDVRAILIGFEYSDDNYLLGSAADLYHAHRWCQSRKFKTTLLTDMSAMDHEFASYFEKQDKTQVFDIFDIKTAISNIEPSKKYIFYYTGHAFENKGLLLPDGDFLSFDYLKCILDRFGSDVFCIFDCCHPDINLPFELKDGRFRLSNENFTPMSSNILVLSSKNENGETLTNKKGSVLSKNLFRSLGKGIYNLNKLSKIIQHEIKKNHGTDQQVMIQASFLQEPLLWCWIVKDFNFRIDVIGDIPCVIYP